MKKSISILIAIMLCISVAVSFTGCTGTTGEEDTSDEFVAATVETPEGLPSSKAEIIAFYNQVVSGVQKETGFTAENKPGVEASESIWADGIKILKYDKATDTATESDDLTSLNKSAKAIKDRILGNMPKEYRKVAFGDMSKSISTVIYPFDSAESNLTVADVARASCSADGNNVNISIILNNDQDTVNAVFGTRDKAEVLKNLNEECVGYATVNDYSVDYVFVDTEEEKTYSTIDLSVELEKQEDGTFKCTGRITSFRVKVIADVKANLTCQGSFADAGDVQVQFRLTDEMNYSFDWLGGVITESTSE